MIRIDRANVCIGGNVHQRTSYLWRGAATEPMEELKERDARLGTTEGDEHLTCRMLQALRCFLLDLKLFIRLYSSSQLFDDTSFPSDKVTLLNVLTCIGYQSEVKCQIVY